MATTEYWTREVPETGHLSTCVVEVTDDRTVVCSIDILRELLAEAGFTYGDTLPNHYSDTTKEN